MLLFFGQALNEPGHPLDLFERFRCSFRLLMTIILMHSLADFTINCNAAAPIYKVCKAAAIPARVFAKRHTKGRKTEEHKILCIYAKNHTKKCAVSH